MRSDGTSFTDHDVHRYLRARGFKNPAHEWFKCTVRDVKAAIVAVMNRDANVEDRTQTFGLRPEQEEAVAFAPVLAPGRDDRSAVLHDAICEDKPAARHDPHEDENEDEHEHRDDDNEWKQPRRQRLGCRHVMVTGRSEIPISVHREVEPEVTPPRAA